MPRYRSDCTKPTEAAAFGTSLLAMPLLCCLVVDVGLWNASSTAHCLAAIPEMQSAFWQGVSPALPLPQGACITLNGDARHLSARGRDRLADPRR